MQSRSRVLNGLAEREMFGACSFLARREAKGRLAWEY